MPRPNIVEILKGKDVSGTWACPCGRKGTYPQITGHRHGAAKRPECQGSMFRLPVPGEGLTGDTLPEAEKPQEAQAAAGFDGYEFLPGDDPTDSEEIARRLLEQRSSPVDTGVPHNGLPKGEWEVEEPKADSPISQSRESVSLPITTRVMYDWFRANGWHQGDGSMSAWVTDVINTFWTHVLGKAIVVVDREEVMADAGARS